MGNELHEHFNKQQLFLKLGDQERFDGFYIAWESIMTKFGKKGYRFALERTDGSRLSWDTSNGQVVMAISKLIDEGLKRGSPIQIKRSGIEKDNTKYEITSLPF